MASSIGQSDGSTVASWTGKNGHTATQSTESKKPLFRTTGNGIGQWPAVSFDGSNDTLQLQDLDDTTYDNWTIYVVMDPVADVADTERAVAGWGLETLTIQQNDGGGNTGFYQDADSGYFGPLDNSPQALTWVFSAVPDMYRNGAALFSIGQTYSQVPLALGYMGTRANGLGEPFKGLIAELLVYRGAHSAGNLSTIHTYLLSKYGL